ncbi:hypothetical protein AOLI_G00136860 [Acnodon oligacanthus]
MAVGAELVLTFPSQVSCCTFKRQDLSGDVTTLPRFGAHLVSHRMRVRLLSRWRRCLSVILHPRYSGQEEDLLRCLSLLRSAGGRSGSCSAEALIFNKPSRGEACTAESRRG